MIVLFYTNLDTKSLFAKLCLENHVSQGMMSSVSVEAMWFVFAVMGPHSF